MHKIFIFKRMKTPAPHFTLISLSIFINILQAQVPNFAPPANEAELDSILELLECYYRPFLRSLPEKEDFRTQHILPEDWDFCYEYQDIDSLNTLPYAYVNYRYDSQEGGLYAKAWDPYKNLKKYLRDTSIYREKITVPEWRYEYRKYHSDRSPWYEDMNPEKMPWNFRSTANVVAWYRTSFSAVDVEKDRRQFLCFDGVDWAAEVYLNGELLGKHEVYSEAFRFDVTEKLKAENNLAVRVIDGPAFGQPYAPWSIFPDIRAEEHLYVPDKERSLKGLRPIGHHSGGGFGIFQPVYLEETGQILISAVFVRNSLDADEAGIRIELDANREGERELEIEILPENFEGGKSYTHTTLVQLKEGINLLDLQIPMENVRPWRPYSPALYRCRVKVYQKGELEDGKDQLFGCRSFELTEKGQPVLNGTPIYLRGTNVQGMNVFSYWGQEDKLLRSVLMLKACRFNIIRSTQHVQFREVRELLDRVGIMSEQDQAAGSQSDITDYRQEKRNLLLSGKVLSRECYNNPGVVLLSFGNECYYDPTEIVEEVLKYDKQRVIKPISGRNMHNPRPMKDVYPLRAAHRRHVMDDYHDYQGWYDQGRAPFWKCPVIHKLDHKLTVGEFGAEGLDAYETMSDEYPENIKPPPEDTDILWAASQVEKRDVRQIVGSYGKVPQNLGQYIDASQVYQAELVATQMAGFRIESDHIAGYYQFHFLDAVPAFWPKSIVSFNLKPKMAYFAAAQVNQPLVPLFRLTGDQKEVHAVEFWISNDTEKMLREVRLYWRIFESGALLMEGLVEADANALGSTFLERKEIPADILKKTGLDIELELMDSNGKAISRYQRKVPVLQWPDGHYGGK